MRRFTTRAMVAVAAIGGGYWAARTLAPLATVALRESDAPTPIPVVATAGPIGAAIAEEDGNLRVRTVLETVERRPYIVAKVRQSLRVGQERLTGEGAFWQQGVGNQRRTRWEIKSLVAGDPSFVTQVFDGEYVWTDRKLLGARKVTRVDVERLKRELGITSAATEPVRVGAAQTPVELLARGGLSQMMADIQRCFTFGPPQLLQRGEQTILATIGQWRPEELEREWPGVAAAGSQDWPAHLPHHVLLYIDARQLFPYLMEYRGGTQAALATDAAAHLPAYDSLACFEFVEVQIDVVPPADKFQFAPAEANYSDVTGRLIDKLRPPAATTEEANTARRSGTWR